MSKPPPPRLSPDDLFAEIVAMIDGLAPEQREKVLVRFAFTLASQIQDPAKLTEACALARAPQDVKGANHVEG